ncbi:MAG: putative quinol monooxygenase [Solirubrobacterales bacterium]
MNDNERPGAAVTVTIRARLKGDRATAQQLHDSVTGATREMAVAAGDVSHRVFLNPADPLDFLGVDEWRSAEAVAAFASSPQISQFFADLFDGSPEVTIWVPSGWNEW